MATIELTRANEYINRARAYGIYIDEKKVGTINNGETKSFEVTPGSHNIYAKIDWCYSLSATFTVDDAGDKKFKVGGFKNANAYILAIVIILMLDIVLRETIDFQYMAFLYIPVLLGIIYILSFGRKKYLSLWQVEMN